MKSIVLFLIALVITQIGLIMLKVDISVSINIIDKYSWWALFIPSYIFALIVAFVIFMLSGLSM